MISSRTLFGILMILTWLPAHAINKCTGPDGKVTYQESACPNSAKDSKSIEIRENGSASTAVAGSWKFTRSDDDMTGKVSCLVTSPVTYPGKKSVPKGFYPISVAILFKPEGSVFGLRTSENSVIFHSDLSSTGVKTDNSGFIPISVRASGSVVSITDSEAFISLLDKAQQLQIRARFWPYDQLYDMVPLSMSGYQAAASQARSCAGVTQPKT